MKKLVFSVIIFAISLCCVACSGSVPEQKVKNRFVTIIAENNIQSIDVMSIEINPSGIEKEEYLAQQLEFNEDGNLLKQVSFDSAGFVIRTMKKEYKDNRVIESEFYNNDEMTYIRTYYMDKEDRDTLLVCTTADNTLLYRAESKYDSIGLKEEAVYSGDRVTYTKRVNDDKMRQVFEARDADRLVYRLINTYDEKGNRIEVCFDKFPTSDTKTRDHFKTTYLDNNLVDKVIYLDSDGKEIKRGVYQYKKFDK